MKPPILDTDIPYLVVILAIVILACPIKAAPPAGSSDFMEIYESHKDLSLKELALKGEQYMARNQNDSALAIFTIISSHDTDRLAPEERSYISEALNSIGIISFMHGNYADAYSKFYSSLDYSDSISSPAYLNLAAIYWVYGDYNKSYEALKTELTKAIDNGRWDHASIAVVNIANLFPSRNLPDKKKEIGSILKRFIDSQPKNTAEYAYPLMIARALNASLQGDHMTAAGLYRRATSNTERMLIPDRERSTALLLAGNEERFLGRPDSALALYRRADSIALRGQFKELNMEVYREISDTYKELGNNSKALEYKYKHLDLNDSLYNIRDYNKIRDIELVHKTQTFQSQLNTINTRHLLSRRTMWITSITSVVLAAMLLWVIIVNRNLRRKNRDLFTMNLEVMELSRNDAPAPVTQHDVTEHDEIEVPKYKGSSLTDARKTEIYEEIRRVMTDEKNFCSEGFTIDRLAELCNTNVKYVSQILNERLGKTFPQYLNELRVDVARRRMVDFEHYGHLTLEALVAEIGFKSRSTFSKTFKKLTGLTPSEFQKIAREHKNP